MYYSKTTNGFPIVVFEDYHNDLCSIQISSLVDDRCVWVGKGDVRMLVNQDQARRIASILMEFASTGHIEDYGKIPASGPYISDKPYIYGREKD